MTDHVFRMPDVGEGIAEAEVVAWLVAVGDTVAVDDPVVEVMTEKASVEITSPVSGTVTHLGGEVGGTVAIGADLIRFSTDDASDEASDEAGSPPAPAATSAGPEQPEPAPAPTAATPVTAPPPPPPRPATVPGARPLAAPSVRRRALEAGIDLRQVTGTGPAGLIDHDDLDRALAGEQAGPARPGHGPDTSTSEIPVIGLRRRIAEHMTLAKSRIPHITYVEEVDVTALEELRTTLNQGRERTSRLTILPFLVRALVRAIPEHPTVNARFDDEAGVVHRFGGVHVGIATQTPKGLVVPVLRHAEAHDLWSSAAEIRRLADAAREGTATREELGGSTITISSLGALGGLATTPVINHPEVAIIGVNKISVRPVWDGSDFVPRQVMNLSSAFDHRIVDGWDAATFVQHLRGLLEQPATLFVEESHDD